jgi:geranylgeranyl pyrophosphate synthase
VSEPLASSSLEAWLERARGWSERDLARELERVAPSRGALSDAMRYALLAPGKRLRPSLVLLVCEGLGAGADDASLPAVAVEMVHAYSLVHDDLPCMDDDEMRRGRPTCHVVYGEALALLAGDALLTAAFEVLARAPAEVARECSGVLARAAGAEGMVRGQVLDLTLARDVEASEIERMHSLKTGALIAASCELGAIAARADPARRTTAREFGRALGACFQAVDDVLDVTGDRSSLGKTPGKDAKLARPTLVAALGLEGARAFASRCADRSRALARELGFAPSQPGFQLGDHLLQRSR